MEQSIRSFIAIELSIELKTELAALLAELKTGGHAFIKWVAPDSIHITLKFLGGISPRKVANITSAIESSVRGIPTFSFSMAGLGAFPNLRKPSVIWAGISGNIDSMINLQKKIDANLTPLGFTPENRPFSPHLTLGRLRESALMQDRLAVGQFISLVNFQPGKYQCVVDHISLMKSQLLPNGPVYTRIAEIKLKD